MDFILLETGGCGQLDLTEISELQRDWSFPKFTLPVGLPPVLNSPERECQSYLSELSSLALHNDSFQQRFVPRQCNYERLFATESCGSESHITVFREPIHDCVPHFKEIFPENVLNIEECVTDNFFNLQGSQFQSTPPGFELGMTFDSQSEEEITLPLILEDLTSATLDISALFFCNEEVSKLNTEPENEQNKNGSFHLSREEKKMPCQGQMIADLPKQWAIHLDATDRVNDFRELIPNMAFEWKFELDAFQKQAILCLEEGKSVLVAAHTSAGKTVVAEYAIALSLKHATRTIYTSPVKALSNQKYRELKMSFDDVGLLTGDVQINDTASCLIVTTEILRIMLYEGAEVIKDLECVIIDEVHYIDDTVRGVVWEEVLILLPDYVKIVLLSASVPNTMELAEWVGKLKRKPVYVISTRERPIPLIHYLYTGYTSSSSDGLYLFCNESGMFLKDEFTEAEQCLKRNPLNKNEKSKDRDRKLWTSVVTLLQKQDKLPAVAFSFSKKKINMNCKYFKKTILTSSLEQKEIKTFFEKCICKLSKEDQSLPQVQEFRYLLPRGFGVHHSGILPILKEMVEILFQKSLIKILFATETFAMGVNMPAKTVIFDDVIKHDGKSFRPLHTGEYVQMSGRAGRRGMDSVGSIVILCKVEAPNLQELHRMALGKPTNLESRFRLSYLMILQLLRVEQLQVQDMMKRSFSAFTDKKEASEMLEQIKSQLSKLKKVDCFLCKLDLEAYYDSCNEYYRLLEYIQNIIVTHPSNIMVPGRIIVVRDSKGQAVFGVVLEKYFNKHSKEIFLACVLLDTDEHDPSPGIHPLQFPCPQIHLSKYSDLSVIEITTKDIIRVTKSLSQTDISKVIKTVKDKKKQLYQSGSISRLKKELHLLSKCNPNGLIGFDPKHDLQIQNIELEENLRALRLLHATFEDKFDCKRCPEFLQHFYAHDRNVNITHKYKELQHLLSDEHLTLLPEYVQMSKVLKNLNYINSHDSVELKGRVACHFMKHEVILTEVIMENVFLDMGPEHVAALLSSFVLETNRCIQPKLTDKLLEGMQKITFIAQSVGLEQREAGMMIPVDVFVNSLHFGMAKVVYNWALGQSFYEVTTLTDLEAGVIVKCIQALYELLGRVEEAGAFIGNLALSEKCKEAKSLIQRDIIFATSLYLQ